MRNAPDITNVVDACNLEGRQERLEGMLSQLEICEKALQVISHTRGGLLRDTSLLILPRGGYLSINTSHYPSLPIR